MTDSIPDLWPDMFPLPQELPPIALLRAQSKNLSDKTGGMVTTAVEVTEYSFYRKRERKETFSMEITDDMRKQIQGIQFESNPIFYVNTYLVAPYMKNYRTHLFELSHRASPYYPVRLTFEDESGDLSPEGEMPKSQISTATQEGLIILLKELFSRDSTQKLIGALYSASQAYKPDKPDRR